MFCLKIIVSANFVFPLIILTLDFSVACFNKMFFSVTLILDTLKVKQLKSSHSPMPLTCSFCCFFVLNLMHISPFVISTLFTSNTAILCTQVSVLSSHYGSKIIYNLKYSPLMKKFQGPRIPLPRQFIYRNMQ